MTRILNFFLIAFLIGSAYSLDQEQDDNRLQGFIDTIINATLNSIIKKVADPLKVDNINLNFTQDKLNGHVTLTNLEVDGIHGLVASYIKTIILSLHTDMTLVIPKLALDVSHDIDVLVLNLVPLYSLGTASVSLNNINVAFGGTVNTTGGLSFTNVKIELELGDGVFYFSGILNNPEYSGIITQLVNDNLIPFVNKYKTQIGKLISPIAEVLINAILKKKSDLVDLNDYIVYT